ncbi:MAG: hypothetical protein KY432_07375 [Acidobacteria bacterium]|nr:hypothetical protein [Acidobacteriota bacterium]
MTHELAVRILNLDVTLGIMSEWQRAGWLIVELGDTDRTADPEYYAAVSLRLSKERRKKPAVRGLAFHPSRRSELSEVNYE